MRDQQQQELNGLTRTHMKRRLLDQLAADHDFDVPPSMVEAEYQNIMAQLRHEASHEADPQAALKEIEADAEDYREIAVRRVRLGLLLSEIGGANNIDVTQQEMNRLIGQAAAQYQPKDREAFVRYIQQNAMAAAQLRAPLYEDKVVDFLFSKAEDQRALGQPGGAGSRPGERGEACSGPGCGHDHHDEVKPKKAAAKKPASKKEAATAEGEVEAAPSQGKDGIQAGSQEGGSSRQGRGKEAGGQEGSGSRQGRRRLRPRRLPPKSLRPRSKLQRRLVEGLPLSLLCVGKGQAFGLRRPDRVGGC